ncbi:MAG TPA: hypothetical protein DCM54_00240 [Gammaproteobacteria bacterium]|nr:hypothetical protein [Gammaproteobacteria bacterium]
MTDALRQHLENNNSIANLEILTPDQVSDAVRLFYRDGFVMVRDVLTPEQVSFLRAGCEREATEILSIGRQQYPSMMNRYSWGGASITNSLLHLEEWVMLADLPTLTPIITAIWDSSDYHLRRCAGEFCIPGAGYQPLHADINDGFAQYKDPRGLVELRDLPCPMVVCNFLAQDFTRVNGPTRVIPGTHHSKATIPSLEDETEEMRLSTLSPAPAGTVMIRDPRTWHGGTPHLSDEMRAIPNAIFLAPWIYERQLPSMPREMFDLLSEHGQRLCEFVVSDAPIRAGYQLRMHKKSL